MDDKDEHSKLCAFCLDRGDHAPLFFKSPYGQISICSDCVKIFYTIWQSREPHLFVQYPETRQ